MRGGCCEPAVLNNWRLTLEMQPNILRNLDVQTQEPSIHDIHTSFSPATGLRGGRGHA